MAEFQQPSAGQPHDPLLSIAAQYSTLLDADGRQALDEAIPEHLRAQYGMYCAIALEKKHAQDEEQRQRYVADRARTAAWDEDVTARVNEDRRNRLLDADANQGLAEGFAAAVLDSAALDQIEIPEPLVANYVDKSSLVRLYGPSNSLKSFVGLDLAGCVAVGLPWHGNSTNRGSVLYVVAEGTGGILKRVRAWEKQYGRTFEAKVYPHPIQIASPEEMAPLIAYATLGGFEFVVFDTQARCTVGLEENSNTEMGRVVAALDALKTATGACVALVHHSGNDGGRARGASAIYAAMDAEFEVKRDAQGLALEVLTMKRKDGVQADPLHLNAVEHSIVTPRGIETSLAIAGAAHSDTGEEIVTYRVLTPQQTDVLVALARYDEQSASAIAMELGLPKEQRNHVQKRLTALAKKGCADMNSRGKYRITEIGWTTLNRLELTTGYHEVADPDDPQPKVDGDHGED